MPYEIKGPTPDELEHAPGEYLECFYETSQERIVRELTEMMREALASTAPRSLAATRHQPADLLALRDTGQSVRTLRSAIAKSQLPAVKVGREFQVRRSDLEAWLNGKAVAPRERRTPALSAADRAIAAAQRKGALRVV